MKTRIFLLGLVFSAVFVTFPASAQTMQPWPGVTFAFDDGYQSVDIARALFKQYNVVATSFPIVGYIGTSGQATWDDLKGLLTDGWEIGSHSMTHPYLSQCTGSQLAYELGTSKQILESNLNTTIHTFALPYGDGANNQTVLSACGQYYHFVRNVIWTYNNLPPSPYHINSYEVYNFTDPSQVIQWIETARSQGTWLVVTFHRINVGDSNPNDEYSFGTNQLSQILQYVQSQGYPTPTFTGVFNQFPPTANAGSNQTVNQGATVSLNGSASSDPCAQTPLTFAWNFISRPAGSSATLSGADTVNPSFTADAAGSYVMQLVVTNSLGVASQAVTVNVIANPSPINQLPVANAGPAQTVQQGATVTLDGSQSSDPDGDPITYDWSFTAKPAGSTAILSNSTMVNPTFRADLAGSYVVQLVVIDSHGAASTPTTVTIITQNSPPVANAGLAQTVSLGALVTLDGSASSDPNGDALTYAWSFSSKPADSTATLSASNSVHPTFTADKAGSYVVQLIVTDSHGTASTPATVTISTQNSPPVANAGPPQTVFIGAFVTLDGSGSSDPEGDSLTYAWSFTSKPTGSTATLTNSTSVNPSFTVDLDGNYLVQLIVTDSRGAASTPATVTISTQNSPPVANAGPSQTVSIGTVVTLDGSRSSDPDGDPISYVWSFTSIPAGSTAVLSNSTSMMPSFTADKDGIYVVQLIVTDSHGAISNPATVTIATRNSPPVANAGPAQTVSQGNIVTLNGSLSSDPDGDTITYAWTFTSKPAGSTAILSDSAIVNPTFTADLIGSYVVQLVVTDSHGAVSSPATVTITAGNSVPVANAGSSQAVQQGTLVTLNGSKSYDPDGDSITFAWSLASKPKGSTAILNNPSSVNPTFTADVAGNYGVRLTVTDSHGAVSTPASVTINAGNSPPSANPGPNQSIKGVGATVQLDGSQSSSPYGGPLTYSWSFTSLPSGSKATLLNATTARPYFVADVRGSYTIQLVVTDAWNISSRPKSVVVKIQ